MREDKKIRQSNQDFSITAEQRPSRHRTPGSIPKSGDHSASTSKGSGMGCLVSCVLFLLLAGVAAGGYWQVTQLHKALADTRHELQETRDQLGLVTGQVSQTGETITQSDSVFRSELEVINSEIRKLWDVSNKRNRQWITENKNNIEQGAKKIDIAVKQADAVKKMFDQSEEQLADLDQMVKAVSAEQLVAQSDLTAHIEALKVEIASLKSAQQAIEQQIQASTQTRDVLGKKLSSFQSQVSLRLQQLENTLRDLGNGNDKGLTMQ